MSADRLDLLYDIFLITIVTGAVYCITGNYSAALISFVAGWVICRG